MKRGYQFKVRTLNDEGDEYSTGHGRTMWPPYNKEMSLESSLSFHGLWLILLGSSYSYFTATSMMYPVVLFKADMPLVRI